MFSNANLNLKGSAETVVTPDKTAESVGSGLLPVFATPMMIAIMEQAAVNAVQSILNPGESTVGVYMDVSHDAATPVGMRVWADAELIEADGRVFTFSVTARDESGPIGRGTHRRVVIHSERFLEKTRKKLGNKP